MSYINKFIGKTCIHLPTKAKAISSVTPLLCKHSFSSRIYEQGAINGTRYMLPNRKTHFQADRTTLQNVSQMGETHKERVEKLDLKYSTFTPEFTRKRQEIKVPKIFLFQEIILQALVRQHLSKIENMTDFLDMISVNELDANNLEVLGEKALPKAT